MFFFSIYSFQSWSHVNNWNKFKAQCKQKGFFFQGLTARYSFPDLGSCSSCPRESLLSLGEFLDPRDVSLAMLSPCLCDKRVLHALNFPVQTMTLCQCPRCSCQVLCHPVLEVLHLPYGSSRPRSVWTWGIIMSPPSMQSLGFPGCLYALAELQSWFTLPIARNMTKHITTYPNSGAQLSVNSSKVEVTGSITLSL